MSLNPIVMGQRIKSARKMRNMSVETLADRIDYSEVSVNHLECGASKPSLRTLYRIANVLDVSMDYLSGRTPDSTNNVLQTNVQNADLTTEQEALLIEMVQSLIPIIKKRN